MSMKKKIVVGITFFLIVLGVTFAVPKINKYNEEKARIDSFAQEKEDLYNKYIDSLESLSDSKDNLINNAIEVIDVSGSALAGKSGILNREIFAQEREGIKVSQKGNEYLEKLEKIAVENLNESTNYVLSNDDSRDSFIKIGSYIYEYLNKENKLLFEEVEEKSEREWQELIAKGKAEWEAEHGISWNEARKQAENTLKSSVQTGMSGSEVRRILGSPNSKHSSSEAEFWNYGDMVLTMKNGYVFDVTRN